MSSDKKKYFVKKSKFIPTSTGESLSISFETYCAGWTSGVGRAYLQEPYSEFRIWDGSHSIRLPEVGYRDKKESEKNVQALLELADSIKEYAFSLREAADFAEKEGKLCKAEQKKIDKKERAAEKAAKKAAVLKAKKKGEAFIRGVSVK